MNTEKYIGESALKNNPKVKINLSLKEGSVTTNKLAEAAVITSKIAEGSVTNSKIADNSLSIDKLNTGLQEVLQAATGLPEELIETIQNVDKSIYSIEDTIYSMKDTLYPMSVEMVATTDFASIKTTLAYEVKWKGKEFAPDSTLIHKTINGKEKNIMNANLSAKGSITTPIESVKEDFTITIICNGKTSQSTSLPTRYLGYIGKSSADILTAEGMDNFSKVIFHLDEDGGIQPFKKSVSTSNYDYIWVVVPEEVSMGLVVSQGLPVTFTEPQSISNLFGRFNAYRSLNPLTEEAWELIIS